MRLFLFILLAFQLAEGNSQPTNARIDHYARKIGGQPYRYPDLAVAVSAVETGYWNPKTRVMKQHNLFAMKENRRRRYVAVGKGGYVYFLSEEDALKDYAEYERYVIQKYGLHDRKAYLNHLCSRFCQKAGYRSKLQQALLHVRIYQ